MESFNARNPAASRLKRCIRGLGCKSLSKGLCPGEQHSRSGKASQKLECLSFAARGEPTVPPEANLS